MNVSTLKQQLAQNQPLILIDVRDAEEIAAEPYFVHPPKQYLNIPILPLLFDSKQELEEKIFGGAGLTTETPIVTLCRSGGRSARACEQLRQFGWQTENLEGGIEAWGKAV